MRCAHRKNLGCCVALVLPSRMRTSVTATIPIMSKPNANREVVVGLINLCTRNYNVGVEYFQPLQAFDVEIRFQYLIFKLTYIRLLFHE